MAWSFGGISLCHQGCEEPPPTIHILGITAWWDLFWRLCPDPQPSWHFSRSSVMVWANCVETLSLCVSSCGLKSLWAREMPTCASQSEGCGVNSGLLGSKAHRHWAGEHLGKCGFCKWQERKTWHSHPCAAADRMELAVSWRQREEVVALVSVQSASIHGSPHPWGDQVSLLRHPPMVTPSFRTVIIRWWGQESYLLCSQRCLASHSLWWPKLNGQTYRKPRNNWGPYSVRSLASRSCANTHPITLQHYVVRFDVP
jgi:hypothetical protein